MRRAGAVALGAILMAVLMTGLLWQRSPGVSASAGAGRWQSDVGAPKPTSGQPSEPSALPAYNASYEWPLVQLNAAELWTRGEGAGVRVAIVGTGIDARNPDLAGAVIAPEGGRLGGGSPGSGGEVGTEIAGLIAGRGSPTDPAILAGLAPQAQLIDIQVAGGGAPVTAAAISAGIGQAVAAGAQIIDVSLGVNLGGSDKGIGQLQNAVNVAFKNGDLVVAPAGPPGEPDTYPAQSAGVIAVAATNGQSMAPTGALAGYGENAVYAPGDELYSTLGPAGYAGDLSGNDLATAYVSAAAALVWSAMPDPSRGAIEPLLVNDVSGASSTSATGTLDPVAIMEELHLLGASQPIAPAPGPPQSPHTPAKSPGGQAFSARNSLSPLDGALIGAGVVIAVMLTVWLALRLYRRRPPRPPGPPPRGGLIERFPIDWGLEP